MAIETPDTEVAGEIKVSLSGSIGIEYLKSVPLPNQWWFNSFLLETNYHKINLSYHGKGKTYTQNKLVKGIESSHSNIAMLN